LRKLEEYESSFVRDPLWQQETIRYIQNEIEKRLE